MRTPEYGRTSAHSLAKTPLKAAQAPDVTARISHAGLGAEEVMTEYDAVLPLAVFTATRMVVETCRSRSVSALGHSWTSVRIQPVTPVHRCIPRFCPSQTVGTCQAILCEDSVCVTLRLFIYEIDGCFHVALKLEHLLCTPTDGSGSSSISTKTPF